MNKPRALQQAKLTYLENADAFRSAPFYWGGFYLVGDTGPITFASSYYWAYLILGLLVLFLAVFLYRHSTKKNDIHS